MIKFLYNIGKALSLFEDETVDEEIITKSSETSITTNFELESVETEPDDLELICNVKDNTQEIEKTVSLENSQKNHVIETSTRNLYKLICERLEKRKIYDVNEANTAAILALLREIQAHLYLIERNLNSLNFTTYEEQYTEILFTNLTNEILETLLNNQKVSQTPLEVFWQIKLAEAEQEKTSWKEDEGNFEDFLREIQEGLNQGFYRKRRRYWSRFSFVPTYEEDQTHFKDSVENQNLLLGERATTSYDALTINEVHFDSHTGENERFYHSVNSKFPFPDEKNLKLEDENNPFQASLTSLTPLDQRMSLELREISKMSIESPSTSVESTSNDILLSLSDIQLNENKQNEFPNEVKKKNLQSDAERPKKMKGLNQQNENTTDKSDDAESGAGPNLIIADESLTKLARALNIAKRFQNENKLLWQQITRLKGFINEKDLEIKRIKLHSKKDAVQDEVKSLKDKLTCLEQEQSAMSQNLRKSEKLCREYERDLDGLEKNLEFAERRVRRAFKIDCTACKKESSRQCVDFGPMSEKENEDQESESENHEELVNVMNNGREKSKHLCIEKSDNALLMRQCTSNEKSKCGVMLRNSRMKKESKNN